MNLGLRCKRLLAEEGRCELRIAGHGFPYEVVFLLIRGERTLIASHGLRPGTGERVSFSGIEVPARFFEAAENCLRALPATLRPVVARREVYRGEVTAEGT